MVLFIQQITKQTNKIKRIAAQLSNKYPQAVNSFDELIMAAIKIQKIMDKNQKSGLGERLQEEQRNFARKEDQLFKFPVRNLGDEYFVQAMERMERFCFKVKKVERKVNIVINDSTLRVKRGKSTKQFKNDRTPIQRKTETKSSQKRNLRQQNRVPENKVYNDITWGQLRQEKSYSNREGQSIRRGHKQLRKIENQIQALAERLKQQHQSDFNEQMEGDYPGEYENDESGVQNHNDGEQR